MSVINAVAQLLSAGGDYLISRSVRLRSSASAYFSKTFGSAGNRKKWTYSAWIKRGALGTYGALIASKVDGNNYSSLEFSGDELRFVQASGGSITVNKKPAGIFRDPSAWYHIIAVMDTDNATAEDRFIIYKNGERVTVWAANTPPALGLATGYINSTTAQWIGLDANPLYFDGLIADVNFIDGLALPASSFGETDPITGVWKPKKYGGSFGTNGFKLDFSDNSAATAAAIGKDSSGNGNNWTPNNISVTAGVTYDSMLDVPTLYADGGNGRGNYATWNAVTKSPNLSLTAGNLNTTYASSSNESVGATIGVTSGKWYWESTATNVVGSFPIIGIAKASEAGLRSINGYYPGYSPNSWGLYSNTGGFVNNASVLGTYSTVSTNDILMFALDMDSGKYWMGKNGTWFNSGVPASGTGSILSSGLTGETIFPMVAEYLASSSAANFGQRPFAYTPPTGFKALNTQNLPDATIKKGASYFDTVTWSGSGSNQQVPLAFTPDFVWAKRRNGADSHVLYDALRGVGKNLSSNLAAAEASDTYGLDFDNGNYLDITGAGYFGTSGNSFVGWNWKESASAGFDIVTQTLGTTGINTMSHGLGAVPKMIIAKRRDATEQWLVYHASGTTQSQFLGLNTTAALTFSSNLWGSSAFSSSQFYFNGTSGTQYLFYLFADVAGFSKFGSFTGNGSTDGPFVYCGFRPRFVMVKQISGVSDWWIWDTSRETYNQMSKPFFPDGADAEASNAAYQFDILSNGFKMRNNNATVNGSGLTYIFAAFAENPFKNSLAR